MTFQIFYDFDFLIDEIQLWLTNICPDCENICMATLFDFNKISVYNNIQFFLFQHEIVLACADQLLQIKHFLLR